MNFIFFCCIILNATANHADNVTEVHVDRSNENKRSRYKPGAILGTIRKNGCTLTISGQIRYTIKPKKYAQLIKPVVYDFHVNSIKNVRDVITVPSNNEKPDVFSNIKLVTESN
ncbi:hypothetical protein DERP_002788 [Dermatophagoides pteronyssinus]|uniref:Uncharacterized protein n=1 Tax=Dermatophagoides pteronyssinus TaxID=6956 RepID=A0ABQ8JVU2_DERPT|nr:hypothetical protein DERP_002788 [Dermatophagoides pteronyssinus]